MERNSLSTVHLCGNFPVKHYQKSACVCMCVHVRAFMCLPHYYCIKKEDAFKLIFKVAVQLAQ